MNQNERSREKSKLINEQAGEKAEQVRNILKKKGVLVRDFLKVEFFKDKVEICTMRGTILCTKNLKAPRWARWTAIPIDYFK